MMNTWNVIVIVLSIISLLFSICASLVAHMALQEKMKMRAKAKALEMSRIEVQLKEIARQLDALPKGYGETVLEVKARRTFQNIESERNSKLVG